MGGVAAVCRSDTAQEEENNVKASQHVRPKEPTEEATVDTKQPSSPHRTPKQDPGTGAGPGGEDKSDPAASTPVEKQNETPTTDPVAEKTEAEVDATTSTETEQLKKAEETPTEAKDNGAEPEDKKKHPKLADSMPGMRQSVNQFSTSESQEQNKPTGPLPQLERRCFLCSKEESEETFLYRCKGCNKRLYCGRDCQTKDWTESNPAHVNECAALKADETIPEVEQKKRPKKKKAEAKPVEAKVVESASTASIDTAATADESESEAEKAPVLTADQKKARVARMGTMTTKHIELLKLLYNGQVFIKHGRSGKPHNKLVFLSDAAQLYWCKPGKKTENQSKCFDLADVTEIREGKTTKVFHRDTAKSAEAENCFSIIVGTDRTLDLVAANSGERDMWVNSLRYCLQKLKTDKQL